MTWDWVLDGGALIWTERDLVTGLINLHGAPANQPNPTPGPFDYQRPWTNSSYDLGYGLTRESRGQGLGTDAARLLLASFVWPRMKLRVVGVVSQHFSHQSTSSEVLQLRTFLSPLPLSPRPP